MLNLEYLILYQNDGTPIYSRCFANMCKRAMSDEVLFSAFLSCLSTFAEFNDDKSVEELELNDIKVKIEYSEKSKLKSIILEDLKLIFFYAQNDKYTIASGFELEKYNSENGYKTIQPFLTQTEDFMKDYNEINWSRTKQDFRLKFESELLRTVIHPFFEKHEIKAKCPFGENCPLRIAIYADSSKTIYERLKNTIIEYRHFNMFKKLKRMMFGSIIKVPM